ncbi:hypothetical protein BDV36DRAFT_18919 [Aspergillus pseudocaelatus]|uniref:HNH nuclease domain-containing protein n=1 Tax=Aspergillus pseudocaelatus TaxID=1825620 RepID=A0ABQ6WY03_9EURO|nr:hypothetical protein BDV36DRAFT_18919 [Aspergillus pseudocaelatus]
MIDTHIQLICEGSIRTLSDYDLVVAGADQNKKKYCLSHNFSDEGKRRVQSRITETFNFINRFLKQPHFQAEQNVKLIWQIKNEKVMICGRQDYSLSRVWRGFRSSNEPGRSRIEKSRKRERKLRPSTN